MAQDVTQGDSLRNAFGKTLVELGKEYDFALFDADIAGGTGCGPFRETYPDRFFNVGIAEQACIGAAAGWAIASGKKAVVSLFGQFAVRGYEIFSLQVAYQRANVLLALSHLGLDTGPDGVSCQPLNYIPLWTSLPGVTVVAPATPSEMVQATEYLLTEHVGPAVLFSGRSEVGFSLPDDYQFKIGSLQAISTWGDDVALMSYGQGLGVALQAGLILSEQNINCTVFNCSTLAPFPTNPFYRMMRQVGIIPKMIVTIEDHGPNGLYSLVTQALAAYEHPAIHSIHINGWGESGEAKELYQKHGLTGQSVANKIKELLSSS